MSKWILAAGAAALAISAPSFADRGGHGHGGPGGGKGGEQHAQQQRGGGHSEKSHDRGSMKQADRGPARMQARTERNQARMQVRADRGHQNVRVADRRVEKGHDRVLKRHTRRDDRRDERIVVRDDRRDQRVVQHNADDRPNRRWENGRGLFAFNNDGCPPGLRAKNNGCLPPGQAKKIIGSAVPAAFASSLLTGPYRDWYRDDDDHYYRMGDDYLYRVRREGGLIDSLIPYTDRDFYYYPVGGYYPSEFNSYNVPYQYRSYYPDGGDYAYRYGDGAIYQVNPQSNMIQSIVALLAGDLSVGQRLPASYGVYNVPLSYRDRYYDTPDAWYRYNDGYIYQVDPTTQLITTVISALT